MMLETDALCVSLSIMPWRCTRDWRYSSTHS